MVRYIRVCLDYNNVSHNLTLVDLRTPIKLTPLEFSSSAPRDLAHMQKMFTIN
jgi:hypothetical protein